MSATFRASADTSIGDGFTVDHDSNAATPPVSSSTRSNGKGLSLYAGKTGSFGVRRGLFKFNLASSANCTDHTNDNSFNDCAVPSTAQVVSVTVSVVQSRVYFTETPPAPDTRFSLSRLTEAWGEGASVALDEGGGFLAAATNGDATWTRRVWNTTSWTTAGGTYVASPSVSQDFATLAVPTTPEVRSFSSTAPLVSDVTGWLATPSTNHGWIMTAPEGGGQNAFQFETREAPGDVGPKLRVTYRLAQGSACSGTADCKTGLFCTNNVCCNSQVCNGATECRSEAACQLGSGVCQSQGPALPNGPSALCDDSNVCTSDVCLNGECANQTDRGGTACRAASGVCDLADTCVDGSSSCTDAKKGAGTACTDDGLPCTLDECDGSSKSCQHPAGNSGTVCRSSAGVCDPAETCNGTSTSCPSDSLASSSQQCRSASCQSSNTAILPAFCSGSSAACPAQQTESCGAVVCTNSACPGSCTLDSQCSPGNYCESPECFPKKDNGEGCGKSNECTSNFCADGVCCNSACGGSDPSDCQSCASGSCTLLTSTCRAASGTCDLAESCSGSSTACPADVTKSASTSCRAASCTSGVETAPANCPGGTGKQCPTMVQNDCSPYICGATACLDSCTNSNQCDPTHYCSGNQCVPRTPQGGACATTGQCQSGLTCTDDVCCNQACTGQCQACDINPGVCTTVPSGAPHGDRPACSSDGTLCGGSCNGTVTTSCAYPGASSECIPATCTAGTETLRSVCNASGACNTKKTAACTPFSCGPTACFGNCIDNVQCEAGRYCLAGNCEPKLENGEACSSAAECSSTFCIDGVCCDGACGGQCEACNLAGSEGACSPVTGDPVGGRPQCVTDGSLCGGVCDGKLKTSCTYAGSGIVCRAEGCANGFATLGAFCNGAGTCPPEVTQDCGAAGCNPNATRCDGNCVVDEDCALGEACSAGICRPQGPNGSSCSRDSECIAGICTDGICCNSTCQGQCEACDVPGKLGLCSPVTGAPHGTRVPCAADGSACGGACDGSTRLRCDYPDSETACGAAASCSAGIAKLPSFCDGSGACPDNLSQICTGACSGNRCAGGCANDAACGAGRFCAAGVCVTKLTGGQKCSLDAQCSSNFCVEGVCCSQDCDEQCFSCTVPGQEGFCTPISGPPRGGRQPCEGEGPCAAQCDGTIDGKCVFPMADVFCGVGACMNEVATGLAQCSGAGSCLAPATVDCAPYRCDGGGCFVECTSDDQCQSGFHCETPRCVVDEVIPGEGGAGPGGAGGMSTGEGGSGAMSTGGVAPEGGGLDKMVPAMAGVPGETPAEGGEGSSMSPPGKSGDSGCGCRLPGQQPGQGWPAAAGLALCFGLWIRRRRVTPPRAAKKAAA